MSWTAPRELKAQLVRLWERGALLRPLVSGDASAFPLRLTLKTPGSADLTDRFEAVRAWAGDFANLPHLRIVWREVRHRLQGAQRLPSAAWVETPEAAIALIGKRREADRLVQIASLTRGECPVLRTRPRRQSQPPPNRYDA